MQFRGGVAVAGPVPRVFVNVLEDANRVGLGWIALALVASFVPARLVLTRNCREVTELNRRLVVDVSSSAVPRNTDVH